MSDEKGYIDSDRNGQIRDIDGNPLASERNGNSTTTTGRCTRDTSTAQSYWEVFLYVPNLMGYLRIYLAFRGYRMAMQKRNNTALNTWIAASVLDLFDGMAARALNQCSQFGVLLDVAADNILRSIVWISVIMIEQEHGDASGTKRCIWTAILFLEWVTMVCSQMRANRSQDRHWKDMSKDEPPYLVRTVFKNNFRTPPGILAIYGLFIAPLGTYVLHSDEVWPKQLLSDRDVFLLIVLSFVGRMLSAAVELWICFDYVRDVIQVEKMHAMKGKED